ncbi:hypothetical protein Acr_00g0100240 [Actinidia rufa]|uniref:Acyl-CoA-binding domain-containing protein n=1 Tax=Actinidia rufa TaxID=165716 RepID=A0A7J0E1I8_9ERIC|nr:hypothetical protein Acr_00g0100240 [Actinidia rufa]
MANQGGGNSVFREYRKGNWTVEETMAQIGELQKMLESLPSIEEEVQLLRSQKTALERDMELGAAVQRQSSGGVWKWIGNLE